jgi:general secretion pathway protein F
MPSFRYVAIDAAGQTRRGLMDAVSEADAVAQIQRQGDIPIRAEPAAGMLSGLLNIDFGGRSMGRQDVTNMTRELAVMLGAGQDLDRSLRFLAETAPNPRVLGTVEALRRTVRDGGALAAALMEHPASFPPIYVGLVRAGEAGGSLAPTLEHLAALMEKDRALASTVKSAMIYPGLLTLAAIGSITLLLTQVLPQFVPLFEQNGAVLPRSTQAMIAAGDFVSRYGLVALVALIAMLVLVRQGLRRPSIRLYADRLVLRLPVIGSLLREAMAARFTRALGTLLINGVPLIAALRVVLGAVGNSAAIAAIERATIDAKDGVGLSRPLADSGIFPVRTIHLLRLGEETAQLGPMALRAADIHEEKTRLGVQRLVALLVPAITIIMGIAIAGIVSSLLLAMLGLNDLAAG